MIRLFLLGSNIDGSLSPLLHNHLLKRHGIAGEYALAPAPEDSAAEELVAILERHGALGANVTSPFKERMIDGVDDLEPGARRIGAINTLKREGERWVGYNTDPAGVSGALQKLPAEFVPRQISVLGSGGAGRAAVWAISERFPGAEISLISRDPDRSLRAMLPNQVVLRRYNELDISDLLVNAVPVAAHGAAGDRLVPERALRDSAYLFDMNYSPPETPLMRRAAALGMTVWNGIPMLLHQGLSAFEVWTGVSAETDDLPGVFL